MDSSASRSRRRGPVILVVALVVIAALVVGGLLWRQRADNGEEEAQALVKAFSYYGVVFIPEDDDGGVGVRRKFGQTKVEMIENWEGEGGPVGEDDI